MTYPHPNKSINDTLEEELRVMLVEKNKECIALQNRIEILEKAVAEEQEQKYIALVRCADLKKELDKCTK